MNQVVREYRSPSGRLFQLVKGDITLETTDAIVNAANAYLQHGGGVAGAIFLRGGAEIQEESDEWIEKYGLVTHQSPAYTHAGDLSCNYVVHAVGPVWGEGDEDNKLAAAVKGSLKVAEKLGIRSISFPAISTGIFRFPLHRAANLILVTMDVYFKQKPESMLRLVRVVLFDEKSLNSFDSEFKNVFLDQIPT